MLLPSCPILLWPTSEFACSCLWVPIQVSGFPSLVLGFLGLSAQGPPQAPQELIYFLARQPRNAGAYKDPGKSSTNKKCDLAHKYPSFLVLRWDNSEACSTRFLSVPSRTKLQLPIAEAHSLKHPFLIFSPLISLSPPSQLCFLGWPPK